MTEEITLNVEGRLFAGWKSVRVQRSLECVSGGFELSASERWSGQSEPFPISPGDVCTVSIDQKPVITGYVDNVEHSYSANTHEICVRGRDKTGDLVDCSAQKSQFNKLKLEQIAQVLIAPFGIKLRVETDTGDGFYVGATDPGEPIFEMIERLARMRGVLVTSDGLGSLVITRRGTQKIETVLASGKNILSATLQSSMMNRYSDYIVNGFHCLGGELGDNSAPADGCGRSGHAKDERVPRYRPLLILAEDIGDASTFQKRAQWEASVRAARAARVSYVVQGWMHADDIWRPNYLVHVEDSVLGFNQELLIVSVNFLLDDRGRRTELSLTYPKAYDLIPIGLDREAAWDHLR